jgi:hypothetical protein
MLALCGGQEDASGHLQRMSGEAMSAAEDRTAQGTLSIATETIATETVVMEITQ